MSIDFTGGTPETLMLVERDAPQTANPLPASIAVVLTEGLNAEHIAFNARRSDAFQSRRARLNMMRLPKDDPQAIHDFARRYELVAHYAPSKAIRPLMAVTCQGWDVDWAMAPGLDEAQARAARMIMAVLLGRLK